MELSKKRNVKLCIAVHSTNYYLPSLALGAYEQLKLLIQLSFF